MPNPSSAGDQHGDTAGEQTDEHDGTRTLETITPTFAAPIRKAGFWGAIVLPVVYLPVLATGLSTSLELGLFLGLVAVNLAALYVGHAYTDRRRDGGSRPGA